MQVCDDNEKMGHAALNCVRSYRDDVAKAQAEVLAKFQSQIAEMKAQQSDSFDRTQAGYQDARKRLDALLAEGKEARAAVDDLRANIAYPEDYDEPDLIRMSTQAYLSSQNCFSIPDHVFQQAQFMIDKIMSDLAATQEAMLGKESGAGTASAHVRVLGGNSSVKNTNGVGSGKSVNGQSRPPASDITGTKPPGSDDLP